MSEPMLTPRSRGWIAASTLLCLLPLLLQLPPVLAVAFAGAALATIALSWRGTLPAPLRLLLLLAMLAAVYWQSGPRFGRDTGCALLAAMLAIKSSELHSLRDARSLLGFALFAPFSAFLLDQGPATTVLALAALLVAVLSMAQLADLEAHAPAAGRGEQWRLLRRLTVLALPLALAAFWLFPRLGSPLWGIPDRVMGRPGLSDHMEPGSWIDLMADDTPALRVQFFGAAPPAQQRYWRGPVLSDFDGRTWSRGRRDDASPAAFTPGPAHWDYQVDYEATDNRQLIALDLPTQAPPGARLGGDRELTSERTLTGVSRWRLRSSPPQTFEIALSPARRREALRLPDGFNPRTLLLGRQWRRDAGRDDAAIVRRAMDWIHHEFAYTLDAPLPGRDGVDEFLFQHKQGFCEHFSSAFVVLMRAAGIPARVVTGYAGGVRNPIGDYYVVRRMDAHAWAEVWLDGRGWVRVDPTAAVAPERIYDTLEDRLATQGAAAGGGVDARWVGNVGDWLRRGWNNLVLSFDAERQQRLLRPFGIDRLDSSQLVSLFVIAALFALGWMAWLLARGERERDPLLRAWHRLGRRYARLGLAREPHEAATAWAGRVQEELVDPALVVLSQRFAEARYAAAVADRVQRQLISDLHHHRPGASP